MRALDSCSERNPDLRCLHESDRRIQRANVYICKPAGEQFSLVINAKVNPPIWFRCPGAREQLRDEENSRILKETQKEQQPGLV